MISQAQTLIDRHNLQPHPEGGFYRETFRSDMNVETTTGPRSAGTAILYLLSGTNVSRFHRIDADEIWHFHEGGQLGIHSLMQDGTIRVDVLGPDNPQIIVEAGVWFGAALVDRDNYCLVGCTVSPGFEFAGFELAERTTLLEAWPDAAEVIALLT
jgi:predicted cupin superfamily sugar epimerase